MVGGKPIRQYAVNKNLELREEIAVGESRPLPDVPVNGLEYVSTRRGWCCKTATNKGGTTRAKDRALRPLYSKRMKGVFICALSAGKQTSENDRFFAAAQNDREWRLRMIETGTTE